MVDLNKIKISIHQMNTVTGDIEGNLEKIKSGLDLDQKFGAEISVFPETAVSGYMCGSLWDRSDFVDAQWTATHQLKDYAKSIGYKGVIVIGFIDYLDNKTNGFPHLKNAVAVMCPGMGTQVYHKQLLASADHHEDKKYFDRGDKTKVFDVNLPEYGPIRIGIPICEDVWNTDHKRNIPEEMVKEFGADLLININQSYFYYGKQEKRFNLLSKTAKSLKTPIVSVNAIGVGDIVKNIVIFDGGSMIFNHKGELLLEMPQFEPWNFTVEYGSLSPVERKKETKYGEITQALIFEQKEFFRLMGIEKAQVHVSGGLDSAIVSSIVNVAMTAEKTVLITNPSSLNSKSLEYVEHLGKMLGNEIKENPIQSIFEEFMRVHSQSFDWEELSDTGKASVHATLRTVQGLAASHQFKSGIVATGNHTEIVLGWASFHDIGSIGVHAILGDLTKTELFQLAEYLNDVFFEAEVIPSDLYNGKFKPAAELPDAMEDPINYPLQSGICAYLIRERGCKTKIMEAFNNKNKLVLNPDLFPDQSFLWSHSLEQFENEVDFAIRKMKNSVYKAAQGAPIVIISPRSRGFSNRETLINKYSG